MILLAIFLNSTSFWGEEQQELVEAGVVKTSCPLPTIHQSYNYCS